MPDPSVDPTREPPRGGDPLPRHWYEVRHSSLLPGADPERVWLTVTDMKGVNAELMPFMRMTLPRELRRDPTIREVELDRPLGRSYIFLGGVIPIDFDAITIHEREDGRRFLERSSTSCTRVWMHERTVDPAPDGARLTDRLTYEVRPHLRPLARPFHWMLDGLFAHRHRRLRRNFAPAAGERAAPHRREEHHGD
ncbi:SRPBCC family protein [Streptomyces triticirhizae]|uniref:SRPBCC family protein n=1 Tax=Streptomyces triticirhizae TaxID=2483353 RepID=A0A3M2LIE4_9ACTN|nr:hypothetical protein [Streptomyces triticirhizae]RMI37239.1 hypothetical protein EBN88_19580 [Streptomyces triticirhizae]